MKTTLLVIAAIATAILVIAPRPEAPATGPVEPGPRDRIDAQTLVSWLISGEQHLHLYDVRPAARFLEDGIRTAESMPADSFDLGAVRGTPTGHPVVLYGETETDGAAVFPRVKAIHDRTYILTGGFEAWKNEILTAGDAPTSQDEDEWSAYLKRVALVKYLTGQTDDAPVPERRTVQPSVRPRLKVKNEGC
jgi:rhodanese-related sulfurtransferase